MQSFGDAHPINRSMALSPVEVTDSALPLDCLPATPMDVKHRHPRRGSKQECVNPRRCDQGLHHRRFKAELTRGGPDFFHSTMAGQQLGRPGEQFKQAHVIFKADDSFGRFGAGPTPRRL